MTQEERVKFLEEKLRISSAAWLRCAEAALAGDLGPLRNRIELSKMPFDLEERSDGF